MKLGAFTARTFCNRQPGWYKAIWKKISMILHFFTVCRNWVAMKSSPCSTPSVASRRASSSWRCSGRWSTSKRRTSSNSFLSFLSNMVFRLFILVQGSKNIILLIYSLHELIQLICAAVRYSLNAFTVGIWIPGTQKNRTIQILDKSKFGIWMSTIWICLTTSPFSNQTTYYHLNTVLVHYSDLHCFYKLRSYRSIKECHYMVLVIGEKYGTLSIYVADETGTSR